MFQQSKRLFQMTPFGRGYLKWCALSNCQIAKSERVSIDTRFGTICTGENRLHSPQTFTLSGLMPSVALPRKMKVKRSISFGIGAVAAVLGGCAANQPVNDPALVGSCKGLREENGKCQFLSWNTSLARLLED